MKTIIFNRWISLTAGVYVMLICGTIYLVPTWANDMKQALNYDAKQMNFVQTMAGAGAYVSVLGGIFLDYFGYRLTALFGAIQIFAGYTLLSMTVSGSIEVSHWFVGIFAFSFGQGSGWTYTAALKANAANFPAKHRGKAVGSMVSFFGLSSGVFTIFFTSFFGHSTELLVSYLRFLAVALASTAVIGGLVISDLSKTASIDIGVGRIWAVYINGAVIAAFVAGSALLTKFADVDPTVFGYPLIGLLALFLFVPCMSGRYIWLEELEPIENDDNDSLLYNSSNSQSNLIPGDTTVPLLDESIAISDESSTNEEPPPLDLSLWKTLMTLDFWLLFYVFFATIGSALALVGNMPELVVSRADYSQEQLKGIINTNDLPGNSTTYALLPLFSVFNTFGRMLAGLLKDKFAHRITAAGLLVGIALLMLLAVAIFSVAPPAVMLGAIVPFGLAYGGVFCVMPVLAVEYFGVRSFGAIWGFIGLAPAFGSLSSGALAGALDDHFTETSYVRVVDKDGQVVKHCLGFDCFSYTLWICCGLLSTSVLAALFLRRRRSRMAGKHRPVMSAH